MCGASARHDVGALEIPVSTLLGVCRIRLGPGGGYHTWPAQCTLRWGDGLHRSNEVLWAKRMRRRASRAELVAGSDSGIQLYSFLGRFPQAFLWSTMATRHRPLAKCRMEHRPQRGANRTQRPSYFTNRCSAGAARCGCRTVTRAPRCIAFATVGGRSCDACRRCPSAPLRGKASPCFYASSQCWATFSKAYRSSP